MTMSGGAELRPVPEGRSVHVAPSPWSEPLRVALARTCPDVLDRIRFDVEPGSTADVNVMVLSRPDRSLLQQWQASVEAGGLQTFEDHLRTTLDRGLPLPAWIARDVPSDSVVVVDDGVDRDRIPRVLEGLLGLTDGVLAATVQPPGGLPYAAVELLRRVHAAAEENGWPEVARRDVLGKAGRHTLTAAGAAALAAPPIPAWAVEPVREASRRVRDRVRASDAQVVGSLDELGLDDLAAQDSGAPEHMDIDVAVAAVVGAVRGALVLDARTRRATANSRARGRSARPTVESTSGRDLLRVVARRIGRRTSHLRLPKERSHR